MKIIFDEIRKDGVLVNKEGKEISRYTYKNIINDEFTFEDLKKDIESFNQTLEMQDEFDNIKELSKAISIHSWS